MKLIDNTDHLTASDNIVDSMPFSARHYLLMALNAAKQFEGQCAPNPPVGALIVKHGHVLGIGAHQFAGGPHAEIIAMSELSESELEGATLYVTLEPCAHHGRTPPCSESIVRSGITKVVYGFLDPNPEVAGRGITYCRNAGIVCEYVCLPEILAFYDPYAHWVATGMPRITSKLALSKEGAIANEDGSPARITRAELNYLTHIHRAKSDAIMTSVRTLMKDNPRLTVRLDGVEYAKHLCVIEGAESLLDPAEISVLKAHAFCASMTLFYLKEKMTPSRKKQLNALGVNCVEVAGSDKLDVHSLKRKLGELGYHRVWSETGPCFFKALLESEVADQSIVYRSHHSLKTPGLKPAISPELFESYRRTVRFVEEGYQEIFTLDLDSEHVCLPA